MQDCSKIGGSILIQNSNSVVILVRVINIRVLTFMAHFCCFLLFRAMRALITLIMEAVSTSETSENFYQTTRRNNPEDSHLHTRNRENLKSDQSIFTSFWRLSVNSHSCSVNNNNGDTTSCIQEEEPSSSVSVVTDYRLNDRGSTLGLRVQTGSGVHPASYPMGFGGPSPGGKVAGA
jgi:hypothetical protein